MSEFTTTGQESDAQDQFEELMEQGLHSEPQEANTAPVDFDEAVKSAIEGQSQEANASQPEPETPDETPKSEPDPTPIPVLTHVPAEVCGNAAAFPLSNAHRLLAYTTELGLTSNPVLATKKAIQSEIEALATAKGVQMPVLGSEYQIWSPGKWTGIYNHFVLTIEHGAKGGARWYGNVSKKTGEFNWSKFFEILAVARSYVKPVKSSTNQVAPAPVVLDPIVDQPSDMVPVSELVKKNAYIAELEQMVSSE